MDKDSESIINNINFQKSSLINWNEDLKEKLSQNLKEELECYIIDNKWLEKYKQLIFSDNLNDSELIEKYKEFERIDNYKFLYSNKIQDLPPIFVLKKDLWPILIRDKIKEEAIIFKGHFGNKILIFKIETLSLNIYDKIYCFFFLDNKELRQGYIKIDTNNSEEEIINKLKNDTPLKFLKEKNFKIKKEILQNFYFLEIIIHDLENVDIKNDKEKNEDEILNIKDLKEIFKKNIDEMKEGFQKQLLFSTNLSFVPNIKLEIDNNPFNLGKSLLLKDSIKIKKSKEDEKIFNPKVNIKKKIRPKSPEIFIKGNKNKNSKIKKNEIFNLIEYLPSKAIKKLSSPGIIGLTNIGATCYMNATLQCFSNITRLRLELLDKEKYKVLKNEKNSNKRLSFALAEVLKNLWEKLEQSFYAPEHFKQVISEMNPLFKGIAANDPKDLVLFLLETMHKELKIKPKSKTQINNYISNIYDFYEVYNNFIQSNSFNQSIISEEFYGYTNSMSTCGRCSITIHNVQLINILFFPLEEVRKFKNYQFNYVRINDCFDFYEKYDIYPSFYCNNCKQTCQACSYTKMVFGPKTLIINLNRGKGLQFKIGIVFEEYLNLRNYIFYPDSPYYYELIGVICHYGTNDMGGHFIAYCKNSNNCEWYKYNDQFVTKCSFSEVKSSGMPYMLFYSYVDVSMSTK